MFIHRLSGRRHLRRFKADLAHAGIEIVGAIVVIFRAAEQPVAIVIAGRHQRVVDAGRGIFLEDEDGPAPVGI